MGGAPPHKNNLIGTAAVGGFKSSWLRINTTAFSGLLFTCSLADETESGRVDHRLTIRLKRDHIKEFETSSKP